MNISTEYISIGGNRNPAAADWDKEGSKLLAFGADDSIALWDPLCIPPRGALLQLNGHTKPVNAVKFFPARLQGVTLLLSGSADHTIRIWKGTTDPKLHFELLKTIVEHQSAITRIATLPGSNVFTTGAADGTVKLWRLIHDLDSGSIDVELLQTINLSPRYFPLSLALATLDETAMVLAVAGTQSTIQMFISKDLQFELAATLTGHEGWIRALDFTHETNDDSGDILLASASQDKYIRLWRIHRGEELPAASNALSDPALGMLGKSLSNKAHRIESQAGKYSVTFEALLLGHEDWIYTSSWRHREGKLQLLSTSEDNSLAIWESDPNSGVWICITRLGEISAQKGSTTATGSAGGLWIGLWSPNDGTVVALGRTGSWRMWTHSPSTDMWEQQVAITGHVKAVKSTCWSRDGATLLTTSSDQTTRLYTKWMRDEISSWHEFSRPQIHGYDLNCIDRISETQFISGADEKLLRVFDEPRGVAELLDRLCDIRVTENAVLQDAANIPVLGLSNKAIQAVADEEPVPNGDTEERDAIDPASIVRKSTLDFNHPPFEDHLARHLLWPETEKLYGHGYEISAVAASHDGKLVATACRASSIDHAVIRLYDTKEWLELKSPLKSHSLTVTRLQFSPDDKFLLSVGRDRQWVVWDRDADGQFQIFAANPKGHTRMILDCSWTPLDQSTFMTASRDKTIKIWQLAGKEVQLKSTVTLTAPVTAVQCLQQRQEGAILFAYGTESGEVGIGKVEPTALDQAEMTKIAMSLCAAKTINQVAWRPWKEGHRDLQLAIASDDSSVRILNISSVA
ncbi:WD40 repeat-like protein [Polyplosphaeria fusca]|uniref:Elongator complex protein 2 n=1 Tax=Polyplosphaeria fusca TaxID=682080 RepID=A0A9P4UZ64_9PLEO|nr:WD40 repeat-like protein [Polyplosphaeria fusca]